jgi:hypothetical protein
LLLLPLARLRAATLKAEETAPVMAHETPLIAPSRCDARPALGVVTGTGTEVAAFAAAAGAAAAGAAAAGAAALALPPAAMAAATAAAAAAAEEEPGVRARLSSSAAVRGERPWGERPCGDLVPPIRARSWWRSEGVRMGESDVSRSWSYHSGALVVFPKRTLPALGAPSREIGRTCEARLEARLGRDCRRDWRRD